MYDISVIVPIYNMDWCLQEHMEKLMKIQHDNVEIILIDDGSTDNSPAICDSFESKNVKVIHKSNGGISSARNAGLDAAGGNLICFYDPDDEVDPEIFSCVRLKCCDLLIFGYKAEYYVDGHYERCIDYISEKREFQRDELAQYLKITTKLQFPVWNKIFKRDIIERHHIRFPAINCWEDACFVMEYLSYVNSISMIPDVCYHYHIEQKRQSLSKMKFVPDRKGQYLQLYRANYEMLKRLDIADSEFYMGNNVRLLYNAAFDFFYNSVPKNMAKEAYEAYYRELSEDESMLNALNDQSAIKALGIWEAKFFLRIFRIYVKNRNIVLLKMRCHIFGSIFAIRKGLK